VNIEKVSITGYLRLNSSATEYVILPSKGFNGETAGTGTLISSIKNATKVYCDNGSIFPGQGNDISPFRYITQYSTTGQVKIIAQRIF
jgi:hypothetical protein